MDMQIPWTRVWGTVITGLVVVFLALILLILFVSLFGFIFDSIEGKKKQKQNVPEKKETSPSQVKPVAEITPEISEDENEVIAAISAAVAMMAAHDGKNYAIKSIKRAVNQKRSSGSIWGSAGQRENTRPF